MIAGWLAVEWLLPGAITTVLPLYAATAILALSILVLAPYLWMGSVRTRWMGRMLALVPAAVLAGAFALNEKTSFVFVGAACVVALVAILAVAGDGVTDSLE